MAEIIVPPSLRERVEALAGTRRESLVLAGALVVVVLGALLFWARGRPAEVAPPARYEDVPASQVAPTPVEVILVHVAGKVKKPGLYELEEGARVADAIEAAGGPAARADLDLLNLAEPLSDGMKIDVLGAGESAPPVAGTDGGVAPGTVPGATPGVLVNVNTGDQAALETIPEVGPVTAAAIVEYRSQIGRYESVEQLLEVSGIGPATLEAIRPYVTV
jgi:competence protein ComEA